MLSFRGWFGEKKTIFNIWLSLNKKVYRRFHNVIIPSKNGTAQIDHIVLSPYGIFIVETKNKKGWIFGSERQPKWTQVIYSNKYSFQNPLRQVYRQKKVLSEFLNIHESSIHTVVYFVGDCEFKTDLPSNVINFQLGSYIKQFKKHIFTSPDIDKMIWKLELHLSNSSLTTSEHVESLYVRHHSTTICPKCGAKLVERVSRNGYNAGTKFLGCERYPKCRFTKNA